MILYSNGSKHAAGAEAVNSCTWADDDKKYQHLGHVPHPANIQASYSTILAGLLKMSLEIDANAGKTTDTIIESTKEWIEAKVDIVNPPDMFMVIQWPEWTNSLIEEEYIKITKFHLYLKKLGIKHIFFNGSNSYIVINEDERYDFGESYIDPHLPEGSFDGWLQLNGFQPVITSNTQYGPEAHSAWAKHVVKHILNNKMV